MFNFLEKVTSSALWNFTLQLSRGARNEAGILVNSRRVIVYRFHVHAGDRSLFVAKHCLSASFASSKTPASNVCMEDQTDTH